MVLPLRELAWLRVSDVPVRIANPRLETLLGSAVAIGRRCFVRAGVGGA